MTADEYDYDFFVVGGGSGGIAAANAAGKLNKCFQNSKIESKCIKIILKVEILFVSKCLQNRLGVKTAVADFVEPSPAGWRKRFPRS